MSSREEQLQIRPTQNNYQNKNLLFNEQTKFELKNNMYI